MSNPAKKQRHAALRRPPEGGKEPHSDPDGTGRRSATHHPRVEVGRPVEPMPWVQPCMGAAYPKRDDAIVSSSRVDETRLSSPTPQGGTTRYIPDPERPETHHDSIRGSAGEDGDASHHVLRREKTPNRVNTKAQVSECQPRPTHERILPETPLNTPQLSRIESSPSDNSSMRTFTTP